IIALYNAEKSIEKSLNSIKHQTWKGDFEIIVVNDGSTDNSQLIVENYINQNPNLNIQLINQENSGVSNARNTGLKIAKGNLLALLDADDEWFAEKTEHQMNILENNNLEVDFIGCLKTNQKIRYPYKLAENNLILVNFRKLMLRNEMGSPSVLFRRKVLENTRFFDDFQRYAEDVNYWLKVSANNKMYLLNEQLVLAGNGKRSFGISGLSANLKEMEKGFQKNLREMFELKRINLFEYILYFLFYRIKYIFRLGRDKFLKLQGK
ncbi:MAG: glycosyltransferase, partial [Chryseobacterium sp.]|nr:glycosyltransferase [Chryseobacterium sp.]